MDILIAQMNPTVGDLKGNTRQILHAIQAAQKKQAHVVLFPELALCGYPPEDLLLLPHFMKSVEVHLQEIIAATEGLYVILGVPRANPLLKEKVLHNSAAIIHNKVLLGFHDKILLPTYDVFDERRFFEPGETIRLWEIAGKKVAITICEDIWQHSGLLQDTTYRRDPVQELACLKPDLVFNLSASPYSFLKFPKRVYVCSKIVETLHCPVLLCNQVGGNDSLIFDGYSLFIDRKAHVCHARGFQEDLWNVNIDNVTHSPQPERHAIEDLYHALVLGVKDYFRKSGFKKACLGLSGGIDSAVVACLAVEALGAENVCGVSMPSRYSSEETKTDAEKMAQHLNMPFKIIPIEGPFQSYLQLLQPHFEGRASDITEENLQARVRGMILMSLSNKFGWIVLTTGNKSELALGYATLYGDMCGGLAVIGDLTKQQVYALAQWINRRGEVIPCSIIERAPSAELRPNQKDADTLPDYAILDQVLKAYVEEHQEPSQIARRYGYPLDLVYDLVKRIHQNEYKRRQAPPSLRISEKSFSVGRRFPIVQGWSRSYG
jgi:NAD+ synthase (glutamine-hydrolysing)